MKVGVQLHDPVSLSRAKGSRYPLDKRLIAKMINVPKFLVCNLTGLKPFAISSNIKWVVGK